VTAPAARDASPRLRIGVFLLFAFLPVSMPAHLLVNHLLGRTWCWYSALLYPGSLLTVVLLCLVLASPATRRRLHARLIRGGGRSLPPIALFLLLGASIVVWTAFTAVLQASYADYWVQRLLVGWVFPMAMVLTILGVGDSGGLEAAWKGLALGASVLLAGTLVLYFASFGVPGDFRELVFVNRTSRVHGGLKAGIYFGELTLGGFNDVAVFFAGSIAAAWGILAERGRTFRAGALALAFVVAALVLEFLCYSRGAILSLGAAALVYLAAGVRQRVARNLLPPLAFALFAICVVLPPGAVAYWKGQLQAAPGTTAEFRVSLWKHVLEVDPTGHRFEHEGPAATAERVDRIVLESVGGGSPSAPVRGGAEPGTPHDEFATLRLRVAARSGSLPRRLLLGYGPGNFGVVQGMTYDAGTHNLFLDALSSSGIPALVLVGGLLISLLVVSGRRALTEPLGAAVGGGPLWITSQAVFAVVVTFLTNAILVNVRVDNLGTSLFGAVLWLLIATACARSGGSNVAEERHA
jgi:hypothetical protein